MITIIRRLGNEDHEYWYLTGKCSGTYIVSDMH